MLRLLALIAAASSLTAAAEPPARKLTPVPLQIAKPFAHITGARELANGKILVTDVRTPSITLLDPATGATSPVGQPGAAADQFTQPAGIYSGADGTLLVADHSGPRVIRLSAEGKILGGYSTARADTRSSSDGDNDDTQPDGRGLAYFVDRGALFLTMRGGVSGNQVELIRLDPVKQTTTVVAKLLTPVQREISSDDGMRHTRSVMGDPADGWGVLADGRIALVRAAPYRVEWVSPSGQSTLGPVIAYDPIPFTDADKAAAAKATGGLGASVGAAGDPNVQRAAPERQYAAVKPPFAPSDVIVSPAGRVWVMRQQAFGAKTVLYDVFDTTGARVDRVEFPPDSRVVGFGTGSVLVREGAGKLSQLRKYKVS